MELLWYRNRLLLSLQLSIKGSDHIKKIIENRIAKLNEEIEYLDLETHNGVVKHKENSLNESITIRNEVKAQHDKHVAEINFLNKMLEKYEELESENEEWKNY